MMSCAALCVPTNETCRREVERFVLKRGAGFWVGKGNALKRLTYYLPRVLLDCHQSEERMVVVDVGAGIHSLTPSQMLTTNGMHPDDSDALLLLAGLRNATAEVHAFESNPLKAHELAAVGARRPTTAPYAHKLTVHASGVGRRTHSSRVAMCGNQNHVRRTQNRAPCACHAHV